MSIERQAERTSKLCEAKKWTIIETLADKGRSAWKGDHLRVGELGKFKQRVDMGEIEAGTYLVIENLACLIQRWGFEGWREWRKPLACCRKLDV